MYPTVNKCRSILANSFVTVVVYTVGVDSTCSVLSEFGLSSVSLVKSMVSMFWSLERSACRARHAALCNCRFAFSEMNWPDSIAVILGCFCEAAMHLRFLRPALCLFRQTI